MFLSARGGGVSVYFSPLVHVHILAYGTHINTSVIHNKCNLSTEKRKCVIVFYEGIYSRGSPYCGTYIYYIYE
jgi:hypothetical protein